MSGLSMSRSVAARRAMGSVLAVLVLLFAPAIVQAGWRFDVSFAESVRPEPFTGRVYLFFRSPEDIAAGRNREPRFGPNWFRPGQFVARDVVDWKPGQILTFASEQGSKVLTYPDAAEKLNLAQCQVQAVARFNPWERNIGSGAGNGFSAVADIATERGSESSSPLTIDKLVPERNLEETKWTELLRVRSERLSRFHGRDVYVQASVVLPASYESEPDRRYPALFNIPGFGGTHFEYRRDSPVEEKNEGGVEFLRVCLDPSCPLGHHVFADSENNGPWGTALVKEFLPEFDRQFRSVGESSARFLTGHSSGGWSSLWVQIAWPDDFGGVWSTSPDPVDFRDFQKIDLYRPGENMYVDVDGAERPIARGKDAVALWYRGFARMEDVLGPGGQLHSFEAVFSPRGSDGRPRLLWDRETGAVDTEVARTWEKYDIRLVLERNWKTLGPKLAGKLHVDMGEADTFYLEGATVRLKQSLTGLGSDAVVTMHPGKDHGTVLTPDLTMRIRREMVEAFLKSHPRFSP